MADGASPDGSESIRHEEEVQKSGATSLGGGAPREPPLLHRQKQHPFAVAPANRSQRSGRGGIGAKADLRARRRTHAVGLAPVASSLECGDSAPAAITVLTVPATEKVRVFGTVAENADSIENTSGLDVQRQ